MSRNHKQFRKIISPGTFTSKWSRADARNNYLKNHKPHLVVLFRDVFYNACFEELYLGNAE
jgi:hypothetical protein